MRDAIPLGRIAGFVVNVHWSVLVILWLFTWSLATMLPGTVGGYPAVVYWLLGAGGAVMLLASLLAHELAHAVVARRAGVSVESVTLWLFGGVTALGGEAKTPKAAFRIAFAGPATSLALSATFGALAITLAGVRTPAIVISSVLEYAAREAKLRQAPILALGGRPEELREIPDGEFERRVQDWHHRHPDVRVYPITTHTGIARFLADHDERVQLAVIGGGEAGQLARLVGPSGHPVFRHAECSVLVVRR